MELIFVDTNVILDILQKREGMLDALRMIMFAQKKQLTLVTSTLSLMNVGYALRHQYKGAALCKVLSKLDETIKPITVSPDAYYKAIHAEWKDFEDSVQYFSAIEVGCKCIVTNNVKDFKAASLPVLKPALFQEFVND